ncbi:MAG TPA: RNA polymerase sigma factor [Ktedonobacterales bacterium]|nr:RNA polymerase sigma factor [Ktedonobacterales bacterium]
MEHASDDAFVADKADGDHDALRELYARYRSRLRTYLRSRLNDDTATVDDLPQEIFLAVWSAAPAYTPQARTAAWIFRIAQHHFGHVQRALSRRPEGHLIRNDAQHSDGDVTAHRAMVEDDVLTRVALADALARLSSAHREVLLLVLQQGFSIDEVASILASPVGTVKRRISYARRALLRSHVSSAAQEEVS